MLVQFLSRMIYHNYVGLNEANEFSTCLFQKQQTSSKFKTNALRVNNNAIANFNGFESTIEGLLENPDQLSWLDMSFNYLTTIDKVSFFVTLNSSWFSPTILMSHYPRS